MKKTGKTSKSAVLIAKIQNAAFRARRNLFAQQEWEKVYSKNLLFKKT